MANSPTVIIDVLDDIRDLTNRLTWLIATFGDRDVNMDRWRHHLKKHQQRRHWDFRNRQIMVGHNVEFYFGQPDMAVQFKLTWSGRVRTW